MSEFDTNVNWEYIAHHNHSQANVRERRSCYLNEEGIRIEVRSKKKALFVPEPRTRKLEPTSNRVC